MKNFFLLFLAIFVLLGQNLSVSQTIKQNKLNFGRLQSEEAISNTNFSELNKQLLESRSINNAESRTTKSKILSSGILLVIYLHQVWDGSDWVNDWQWLYSYDSNDNLLYLESQNWIGSNWESDIKETYSYDGNDNVINILVEEWDGSNWVNFANWLYSYDNNNLIEKTRQYWNTPSWVNDWRELFTYDVNINLIEEYRQTWDGFNWINTGEKLTYTFDVNNKLIEKLSEEWSGTNWVNYKKWIYGYNNIDSVSTRTELEWDSLNWINVWRWQKTYYPDYYLFEWWDEEWDGQNWINAGDKITYFYDVNHHLIEEIFQDWGGTNWVNMWRHLRSYDVNNNLREWWDQSWNGSSWVNDGGKIIYSYDVYNNLIEEVWHFWDGSNWVKDNRYEYSYIITDVESNDNVISDFNLGQNYPNPFNPSTNISWQLPKAGIVTLKIFDVLGREVATLVNEELVTGKHKTVFDAAGFSSGIYFYQLKVYSAGGGSGNFIETKKMLLLK